MFFKDSDKVLVKELKKLGVLYKHLQYQHSYPHCWRCHTPLMYYAQPSWYIRTTAIKEALMGSAIILYDAFGREMLRSVVQAQETIINLHHLPTGLYFVQVGSETRRLEVVR